MTRIACILLIVCVVALCASAANAQVFGRLLADNETEVGATVRWTRMNLNDGDSPLQVDQTDTSGFLRFGVSSTLTLSGELTVANDTFFRGGGPNVRYYHAGAGAKVRAADTDYFTVFGQVHASNALLFRSGDHECNQRQLSIMVFGSAERAWEFGDWEYVVDVGYGYWLFDTQQDQNSVCPEIDQSLDEHTLYLLSAEATFLDHFTARVSNLQGRYAQPRLSLAYRF